MPHAHPQNHPASAPGGRVAQFPARHGLNTADALAKPWRALSADHVREVRQWADHDPRRYRGRLPRWQQRSGVQELTDGLQRAWWYDTKTGTRHYAEDGRSWVWRYDPEARTRRFVAEGSKDRICWLSRDRFLTSVLAVVLAEDGARDVLRAHKVDPDTFRSWVRHESLYADQSTGRRVIVRAVTVAALMEVDKRTVQRCRAVGRALGLYVTLFPGRMLTAAEQVKCRHLHKSPQRGQAAESAFVVPRSAALLGSVSCLHRGPADGQFPSQPESLGPLNPRGEKEPTPSAPTQRRRRRGGSGWKLAVAVTERVPFARGSDPRTFAGLLHKFAVSSPAWTAEDVLRHIERENARMGWSMVMDPADLRAPVRGLLRKYLADADPVNDHPRLDVLLAADRRTAEAAELARIDAEIRDGIRCCRYC